MPLRSFSRRVFDDVAGVRAGFVVLGLMLGGLLLLGLVAVAIFGGA